MRHSNYAASISLCGDSSTTLATALATTTPTTNAHRDATTPTTAAKVSRGQRSNALFIKSSLSADDAAGAIVASNCRFDDRFYDFMSKLSKQQEESSTSSSSARTQQQKQQQTPRRRRRTSARSTSLSSLSSSLSSSSSSTISSGSSGKSSTCGSSSGLIVQLVTTPQRQLSIVNDTLLLTSLRESTQVSAPADASESNSSSVVNATFSQTPITAATTLPVNRKRDLTDLLAKYSTTNAPAERHQKTTLAESKQAAKLKEKDLRSNAAKRQLTSFRVKRDQANETLFAFFFLNSTAVDAVNENTNNSADERQDRLDRRCDECVCDDSIDDSTVDLGSCGRAKRPVALKKLIRSKELVSLLTNSRRCSTSSSDCGISLAALRRVQLSANALTKSNRPVSVKYHVYKRIGAQLEEVLSTNGALHRCSHIYKSRRDTNLSAQAIAESKQLYRSLRGIDFSLPSTKRRAAAGRRGGGGGESSGNAPAVVNNALDHQSVTRAAELTSTYDQMYLEFLISIQHREITPEDYEYLSRLDELVKKKTLNEAILNGLRIEPVTAELLARLDAHQEVCGICLDTYALGQQRKCLPCGHAFHADCVDNWLRHQATTCPLDNLPVEVSSGSTELYQKLDAIESVSDVTSDNNDDSSTSEFKDDEINDIICSMLGNIVDRVEAECNLATYNK